MLALHGADDPFVPATDLEALEKEMRDGQVDWQLVKYGGAVHSFTGWNVRGIIKGAEYKEKAGHHSWGAMPQFLAVP